MIHLPNHNKRGERPYSAEDYLKLADDVATLPAEQLERAIVLAADLPKSVRAAEPVEMRKAQVRFIDALTARYPFVEELLKAVNLHKVFSSLSMGGPWKGYEKILAAIDAVEEIDGGRFTMAVMERCFSGGAEEALLRGALERNTSTAPVFAAYRDCLLSFKYEVAAKLHLDGEMFAGASELRDLQSLCLFGTHTRTAHLQEMTALAPFHVQYLVSSPKLANLLPLRSNIKSLTLQKTCADYTPLLQFEKLEKLVVAEKDLAKVFTLLGHREGLRIDDSGTAHDTSASARLRAKHAPLIKTP